MGVSATRSWAPKGWDSGAFISDTQDLACKKRWKLKEYTELQSAQSH